MARTVTLSELRTQARQRADMVGSNFVSDSELNGYINASIAELYDLLVLNYGEEYFTSPTAHTFSTSSGTDMYDLPATFYKLSGIDVLVGSRWVPIKKYQFKERNRGQDGSRVRDARYRLHGSKVRFTPEPTGTHSVRMWYIPAPTKLSLDADTFDGISGWEEYVVVDAAMKMLSKEESDVSVLSKEKDRLTVRIQMASANRDVAEAECITDIEVDEEEYDYVYGVW